MKKQRIFFFGTPEIAVPTLKAIANNENAEIVGVGVFPDKPVGRKQVLTSCAVKKSAEKLNLPIFEISDKKKLVEIIEQIEFDLGLVIAFGMIFPKSVLGQYSFVNVHFSLLPEWRGASPVQAAILNGQTTTGITWQTMVSELDAGDVLYTQEYDITGLNTIQVWDYFAQETAKKSADFLDKYISNSLSPTPQDPQKATFCGKFTKNDGFIDPKTETAQKIWQKFLGLTPWPGIYLETKHGNLKILELSLTEKKEAHKIDCASQTNFFVTKVQLAGKKAATAKEIINGYPDLFKDYE